MVVGRVECAGALYGSLGGSLCSSSPSCCSLAPRSIRPMLQYPRLMWADWNTQGTYYSSVSLISNLTPVLFNRSRFLGFFFSFLFFSFLFRRLLLLLLLSTPLRLIPELHIFLAHNIFTSYIDVKLNARAKEEIHIAWLIASEEVELTAAPDWSLLKKLNLLSLRRYLSHW